MSPKGFDGVASCQPARSEQLAERRRRRSRGGIDAEGHVGAQEVASVDIDPDRTVYCCERGVHFTLAYRLYEWKKGVDADAPAIATKLEELAELGGVGNHATPSRR